MAAAFLQFVVVPLLAALIVWLFEIGPLTAQARRNRAQRRKEAKAARRVCRRRGYEKPLIRYGSSPEAHETEQGRS